nr:MAG TPA: hypothetical protein [Bacteriophage sp.]
MKFCVFVKFLLDIETVLIYVLDNERRYYIERTN